MYVHVIDLHAHTSTIRATFPRASHSRGFHYSTVCLLRSDRRRGVERGGKQLTTYVPGSCSQQLAAFQATNHIIIVISVVRFER